tara:strand:+ start:347 stop:970 length:624 start_codon:yes stop_codon:yes gene_type:complete
MNTQKYKDVTSVRNAKKYDLIRFCGVGGAGIKVIEYYFNHSNKGKGLMIDTRSYQGSRISCCEYLTLGNRNRFSSGAHRLAANGRVAAQESRSEIIRALKGVKTVILVAGTGGGTGSGSSVVLADACKEMKIQLFVFLIAPFEFEGDGSTNNSRTCQKNISVLTNNVYFYSNQDIMLEFDKTATVADAFEYLHLKICLQILSCVSSL